MNILMALSQLEITGAEVYATTVGNALARRGHTVTYVSDTLSCPAQGRFIAMEFNKRSWPRRLWQIARLIWVIKRHKIQLVHAHSRASGWASYIACKLTKTPMVTTVHGRQPVHASRKAFHAFGFKAIAICEDVKNQIIDSLGVAPDQVVVIPNGIDSSALSPRAQQEPKPPRTKPVVSIVGRLTGPKGELCYRLVSEVLADALKRSTIDLQIITASPIPSRFDPFKNRLRYIGPSTNMAQTIAESDLVIGAGRVAVEALLMDTPVVAIGEAKAIGLVTPENIDVAMQSNFGDIGPKELDIDFVKLQSDLKELFAKPIARPVLREKVIQAFDLNNIVSRLELLYQDAVIETQKREMPILMYHRFIEDNSEKGIHGTWTTVQMFEKHLRLIQRLSFETLTFKDIEEKGFIYRLTPGKRFLMITVDDGYKDNLTRMLPLLKKYNMKATVFIVSNETHNRWDTEHPTNPDTKVPLLTADEIRALDQSGHIEIGGHTLSHAKLDELEPDDQRREIIENKRQLEAIIGHPMLCFAYPYGVLNESAKQQAQAAGYAFAVATDSGPRAMHQDRYQIRRINVFPRTDTFGLWRKIRGSYVWRR